MTQCADWVLGLQRALTATAGLALVACLLLFGGGWTKGDTNAHGYPLLAALSNQNCAVCLGVTVVGHNRLAPIFGWTNDGHFPSTNPSLDQLNTNYQLPKL